MEDDSIDMEDGSIDMEVDSIDMGYLVTLRATPRQVVLSALRVVATRV